VPLTKVVTTLGKPGVAVASITRRHHGHALALVEGQNTPLLNGQPVDREPVTLKDGDVIELAGTRMRFHLT
jgi:pSer/pThr/pTyr-binding forkhead associated (FHA) protein